MKKQETVPPPCDTELLQKGETVACITGANPATIEAFIKLIAKESGQRVDWHYVGGRAAVRALGDTDKVKELLGLLQMHILIY